MDIIDKLIELRKKNEMSQMQVAQYLTEKGYKTSNKSVSYWETGTAQLDATRFVLLCELYKVTDMSVFYDINMMSTLNDLGISRLNEYTKLLRQDNRFIKHPLVELPKRSVKLFDLPVSAGTGEFLHSENYSFIDLPDDAPKETTFAVRIAGDSMTPLLKDGDIAYIRSQNTLDFGDVGIFSLNGDAYCKKLVGNMLVSLNTKYDPIEVSDDDSFHIFGKVLGL